MLGKKLGEYVTAMLKVVTRMLTFFNSTSIDYPEVTVLCGTKLKSRKKVYFFNTNQYDLH